MLWLLKLTKVSRTVSSGYPPHWSLRALKCSHCVDGGHAAARLGAPSQASHNIQFYLQREESFRRRLSLRSNMLRPCGSHTSPHLVSHIGAVRPELLCELQELYWSGVRGRTELSYCSSAVLTTKVLSVLPLCKPMSSHLTASGASSSWHQLSSTEPFRDPA